MAALDAIRASWSTAAAVLAAVAVVALAVVALAVRYGRVRSALRALVLLAGKLAVIAAALTLFVCCLAFPFLRGLAWKVVVTAVGLNLARRGDPGRQEGRSGTPDRGSRNVPEAKLNPVSAQKVATAPTQARRPYGVHAMSGPGLLALWVGASGMGKTELRLGTWRAQYDGEDFCGLATTRGGKKLWLTEMQRDLARDFLRRWGFLVEPNGAIDRVRLALWTPRHSPGAYLDIEYAADVFVPDSETGAVTDWPRVLARLVADRAGEKYDEICVDTMAEWLGSDNNDAASESLGLCGQLTKRGAGVTVLHHTPLSDPRRPKGGMGVWRAVDQMWSLYGTGPGYGKRTLKDPERVLECLKARRQEDAPDEPLRIAYALAADADSGGRPSYRLVATADQAPAAAAPTPAAPALTERQRDILEALRWAPERTASTPEVAAAVKLSGDQARESLAALKDKGLVAVVGTGPAHTKGSKPPTIWRALAPGAAPADPAARLLREALDA